MVNAKWQDTHFSQPARARALLTYVHDARRLWMKASLVTDACGDARKRGVEAISTALSVSHVGRNVCEGSRVDSHATRDGMMRVDMERKRARDFVKYADLRAPGFSCHRVTISFNLGMIVIYPIAMIFATVAFPFAVGIRRPSALEHL